MPRIRIEIMTHKLVIALTATLALAACKSCSHLAAVVRDSASAASAWVNSARARASS